jgi:hypothetical protein
VDIPGVQVYSVAKVELKEDADHECVHCVLEPMHRMEIISELGM